MAVAVLVMTAGSAAAVSHDTGTAAAQRKPHTYPYTETATCAPISTTDSSRVIVCAGTNSLDGNVAAVATITRNGLNATDTAIQYTDNGSRRVKEAFAIAAGAGGVFTLTGTGTCVGGTGVFKHAKCSYKLTGTISAQGNGPSMEVGTITR